MSAPSGAQWFVGIDPGQAGALAFYDPRTDRLEVHDMPTHRVAVGSKARNRIDVYRLGLILMRAGIRCVLIEEVHALPRQGVSSMFAFGFGAGALHGCVGALQLPLQTITPNEWKRAFKLSREKDQARQAASRALPRHAGLWPLKKHHGRAEAALLALFCARTQGGA